MDLDARRDYERAKMAAVRRVGAVLDDLLDRLHSGPTVRLTCPRGHPLLRVLADRDDRGWQLAVVGDRPRDSGPVTTSQTPIGRARTICRESGCPTSVPREGWCPAHGDRPAEVIDAMKTGFTCRSPKCGWTGAVVTAELLRRYGAAVRLGHDRVPVTGDGTSPRRRAVR